MRNKGGSQSVSQSASQPTTNIQYGRTYAKWIKRFWCVETKSSVLNAANANRPSVCHPCIMLLNCPIVQLCFRSAHSVCAHERTSSMLRAFFCTRWILLCWSLSSHVCVRTYVPTWVSHSFEPKTSFQYWRERESSSYICLKTDETETRTTTTTTEKITYFSLENY